MSRLEKYGDLDFSDEREARRSERRKKSIRHKAKKPTFDADDYVDLEDDYDPYEDWHDLPRGRDTDSFDNY